jgi:hypothetical protein
LRRAKNQRSRAAQDQASALLGDKNELLRSTATARVASMQQDVSGAGFAAQCKILRFYYLACCSAGTFFRILSTKGSPSGQIQLIRKGRVGGSD